MDLQNFEFTNSELQSGDQEVYVGHLPPDITSVDLLLEAIAERLQFPAYFGANWNALADCLTDFHWIQTKTIRIVHVDLPKIADEDLKIYLEILRDSVTDWGPGDDHALEVVFPADYADTIAALLGR